MGDRGNIVVEFPQQAGVEQTPQRIYLYTHWHGYRLGEVLRKSLSRGTSRWDDPPYLARIIFSDMIEGQEQELTGFGISPDLRDNNRPLLRLSWIPGKPSKYAVKSDVGELTLMVSVMTEDGKTLREVFAKKFIHFTDEQLATFTQEEG